MTKVFLAAACMVFVAAGVARAEIVIQKTGCYRITGRIESTKDNLLQLTLAPGTRSHESLRIRLSGKAPVPEPGNYVSVVASVATTGDLDSKSRLRAGRGTIRLLNPQEYQRLPLVEAVLSKKKDCTE
jgi:hypothetical protein